MTDLDTVSIGAPLLRVFGRLGCGGLILSTQGHLLAANPEAQQILQDGFGFAPDDLDGVGGTGPGVIPRLLARARAQVQLDAETWMLTTRASRRPLIMSAAPMPVSGLALNYTMLTLIDLDRTPCAHMGALERIFGLSAAEARLAAALAGGSTVAEAALTHRVSVATIRSQLAAIFAKTHTSRQAELVMLISRLAAVVMLGEARPAVQPEPA